MRHPLSQNNVLEGCHRLLARGKRVPRRCRCLALWRVCVLSFGCSTEIGSSQVQSHAQPSMGSVMSSRLRREDSGMGGGDNSRNRAFVFQDVNNDGASVRYYHVAASASPSSHLSSS